MAKVHKMVIYLIDANGDYDHFEEGLLAEYVKESLEMKLDVTTAVTKSQSSKEFEWDDDLKINNRAATIADYEEYFK